MLLPRRPTVAALSVTLITALSFSVAAAAAQTVPLVSGPSGALARYQVQNQNRNSIQDRSLRGLLEKVVWDPAQRGPLLIVAPEKTLPMRDRNRSAPFGEPILSASAQLPEPGAGGTYRLADIGDYFGRRVRTVGKSLTIFAPTTMTVLPTRLPEPNPYAGMGPSEKLRLFQSTLTPGQWATLGSTRGIGMGDLDRKQRDLFLSMLPDPFVVQPIRRGTDGQQIVVFGGPTDTHVTLTPAQRQSVRLSLHRVLDWSFMNVGSGPSSGRTHVGSRADDGEEYQLRGAGFGSNFMGDRDTIFGVSLLTDVPARLKPGQLPLASDALNAPVPLGGAATVGELVRRAAAQTGVDLVCDPRYANLAVYTRGAGGNGGVARAGDLLEALCLGVTGTFRKVGGGSENGAPIPDAYVLTDDLEGLGARHARIQAWASANAALAEQRRNAAEELLLKAPIGESVTWKEGDPQRPAGALADTIEAFRKKITDPDLPIANTPVQQDAQTLIVPVTDLPTPVQEKIRTQLEDQAKQRELRKSDPFFANNQGSFSPLREDRIVLDVQVRASFVVPDMGSVSAQGSGYSSDAIQSLTSPSQQQRRMQIQRQMMARTASSVSSPLPTPFPIPPEYRQRVLLVAPATADEAVRTVAAAASHGLNQVWIESPDLERAAGAGGPDFKSVLTAAIEAGKKEKIAVGAVVRLLRVPASSIEGETAGKTAPSSKTPTASLPPDRNILGETTSEFAARRALAPAASPFSGRPVVLPQQEAERLVRRGDWLLAPSPAVRADAAARVTAVTETPGLAGIVLRDTAAPGYDGITGVFTSPFDSADGAEQLGYTAPMRRAFLREAGIDPIDLSPLQGGRIALPFGTTFSPFIQMQLPFFPDYGQNPSSMRIGDQSATEMGARDGAQRWRQFRASQSDAMIQQIVIALRTRHPDLSVWVQRGADAFSGSPFVAFFDTAESVGSKAPAASTVTQGRPVPVPGVLSGGRPGIGGTGITGPTHSPQALLMARCPPPAPGGGGPGMAATMAEAGLEFTRRLSALTGHVPPGWGGIILDLTEAPSLSEALPLLNILRP